MKRVAAVLASAALALGVVTSLPAPAEARLRTVGKLRVSVTKVQRYDTIEVVGKVPPRARRKVILQRKTGWGWAAQMSSRTNARGRFHFSYEVRRAPGRLVLRVVAPRRFINGRRYQRVKTPRQRLKVVAPPRPAQGDIARITAGSNVSTHAVVSADGRFVTFESLAPDLVPGDTNDYQDVFLHDRQTGETTALTNGRGTSFAGALSADGRYVVFDSYASSLVPDDTNRERDVFIYDRSSGGLTRITDGNDGSYAAAISADGRYVVYFSFADNLVPDDTNGYRDVFVYDQQTGQTTKLTGGNGAALAPSISADGRWVAFYSGASNLVPDDRNSTRDVFLYDRDTGTTTRVTNGNAASYTVPGALSADGRYLTYYSYASDLVDDDTNERADVFVYDRVAGSTTRLTDGDNHSQNPTISADGLHVAFESYASDLVRGDDNDQGDVFVYDVADALLTRITAQGTAPSSRATVSGDGGVVAFSSLAGDLVPDDTNNLEDVFAWARR